MSKRLISSVTLASALLHVSVVSAEGGCGACAPQCGTNYNNDQCASTGGVQRYPQGAYVNGVTGAATQPPTPCMPAAFPGVPLKCPIQYDGPAGKAGTQDNICYVTDPVAHNGTVAAIPQCYNPLEQTCTGTNFLCAVDAPYACGRLCFDPHKYVCITDHDDFYNSQLLLRNQTAYPLLSNTTTAAVQQSTSSVDCASSPPAAKNSICPTECAIVCGTNYKTDACELLQAYPTNTYVTALQGVSTVPQPRCIAPAFSGVSLECPIQYDGPAGKAGTQDNICYVSDPEAHNGTVAAIPQCYNPLEQTCTGTNFLCAVDAPYACGRACFDPHKYVCIIDEADFFGSQLVLRNTTAFMLGQTPGVPAEQPVPSCSATANSSNINISPNTNRATPSLPTTGVPYSTNTPAPTCHKVDCAPTCGADAFTAGKCDIMQSYPVGAYVSAQTSQPVAPVTGCHAPSEDGLTLQCPIQYDGPAGLKGTQDNICYVYYPAVFGDDLAHPFCYNPLEQTCTGTNFLCAVDAPLACGAACFSADRYTCEVDSSDFMKSKLIAKVASSHEGSTATFASQPAGQACAAPSQYATTNSTKFVPPAGTCSCSADLAAGSSSTGAASSASSTASPTATPASSATAGALTTSKKASSAHAVQATVGVVVAIATALFAV